VIKGTAPNVVHDLGDYIAKSDWLVAGLAILELGIVESLGVTGPK
jgi:hypothetical protein